MEKRTGTTKGLVFGKFLPPHKGHLYLISEALKNADELIVLVCSRKRDPIPGYLRAEWVRKIFPGVNVVHMTDEIPAYPHEHPDFWKYWLMAMDKYCKDVNVVFTSENYGDELGEKMGIRHCMIDLHRSTFPVSGTAIRTDPFKNWEFIPEVVRPYYVKRIVLTGPESCGKSVLAEKLSKHFSTVHVAEYGREYMDVNGQEIDEEDISNIAAGQLLREDETATRANQILFCDTDLIVTQIWSEIYFNSCPEWIINVNHQRSYDLHLLLDCDIPWVDDGTRKFEHKRKEHFSRLRHELESRNLPFVIINGDFEEQLQKAINVVEEMMKRSL